MPEELKLAKRPVAWRVRDCADGWIIYQDEETAYWDAEQRGALMQGLYVRDGTPLTPEQQPTDISYAEVSTDDIKRMNEYAKDAAYTPEKRRGE